MSRYHAASSASYHNASFTLSAFYRTEKLLSDLRRNANARYIHARNVLAAAPTNPREAWRSFTIFVVTQATSPLNVLILLWIWVLCWGEVWTFDNSIERCDWNRWENWPAEANPHHIAFVTDPQLVDPHTYPGRPWPLSALTVKHTDLYLRRSYSRIQQKLDPNTILFLGDLFDGGREWATSKSHSPERRYRQYGDEFWLEEFERFSAIFLREWKYDTVAGEARRDGRRIIASLPGNHDLGFGRGIQKPVRDRFEAYFGEGNRLDIIGNHTFVSIDTVSLSAIEQVAAQHYEEIWRPSQDFMRDFQKNRATAIANHLRHLHDAPNTAPLKEHTVVDMDNTEGAEKQNQPGAAAEGFPTVLLTHVPLYRMQGEPCGPYRERYPPVPPPPGQTEPFKPDDPNSIPINAGYQYQNVLSGQISSAIAQNLGGSIEYVFSGDDHDYCEVVHRDYANPGSGIKEVTVKSISEAAGIRKPGFLLASLWNPINAEGRPISPSTGSTGGKTLQSQLCLLPEEFSIVMKYLVLLFFSLVFLFFRAANRAFGRAACSNSAFILPTSSASCSSAEQEKSLMNGAYPNSGGTAHMGTTFSSPDDRSSNLLSRASNAARARSSSPVPPHVHGVDAAGSAHTWAAKTYDDESPLAYSRSKPAVRGKARGPIVTLLAEWAKGTWYVARVVLLWYIILFNWY